MCVCVCVHKALERGKVDACCHMFTQPVQLPHNAIRNTHTAHAHSCGVVHTVTLQQDMHCTLPQRDNQSLGPAATYGHSLCTSAGAKQSSMQQRAISEQTHRHRERERRDRRKEGTESNASTDAQTLSPSLLGKLTRTTGVPAAHRTRLCHVLGTACHAESNVLTRHALCICRLEAHDTHALGINTVGLAASTGNGEQCRKHR